MDDVQENSRYYARRAAQERAVVARSDDPLARRVHAELAERYAALRDSRG
ncbi:hypothetical protein PX554_01810 [Sphingomonas sp. H39-1-10]|nr:MULTISPECIES: hypothetical protein [Sphingomonas]MDF0486850.1 hypothetical protein [Sphingomonas pollutisoli]SDA34923.1 hypothetical protein SAMN03159340_03129 [Sphingomonas sp. NFR15]